MIQGLQIPDLSSNTGLRTLQIAGLRSFEVLPQFPLPFLRSLKFRFTVWRLEDLALGTLPWNVLQDFLRRHESIGLLTIFYIVFAHSDFGNMFGQPNAQLPIDFERRKAEVVDIILEKCGCTPEDSTVSVHFEGWEDVSTG